MKTSNLALTALAAVIAFASAGCTAAEARTKAKPKAAVVRVAPVPPVACSIVTTRTAYGTRLDAVVTSQQPLEGSYDLMISKSGSGGTSQISQGGAFAAEAKTPLTLASSEIGADRSARLQATLVIHDKPGAVCRNDIR